MKRNTDYFRRIGMILICIAIIAAGVFMVIYGEMDDSPGGQLLGLVLGIIGIVGVVRNLRR